MKNDSVAQRAERFREVIGDLHDNIPLITLLDKPAEDGHCVSCGVKLKHKDDVRCDLCADALWTVLFEGKRPKREKALPRRSTSDLNEYDD